MEWEGEFLFEWTEAVHCVMVQVKAEDDKVQFATYWSIGLDRAFTRR